MTSLSTPNNSFPGSLVTDGNASNAPSMNSSRRTSRKWSNIRALQGTEWKGRFRKRAGPYRIIFRKAYDRTMIEISAILIKSKDTYR